MRKLTKLLFRLREYLVRDVEIHDGNSRFRFRCASSTEFARCMKMFIKEPGTCDWIKRNVNGGDVFYDIGANIGVYTVLAARRVGESGRVFAFEPHTPTFVRLLENISANRLEAVVSACNFALHAEQGFFPFVYSSSEGGASESQLALTPYVSHEKGPTGIFELKFSASIDQLISASGFPPPKHVKIDVDGNELYILRGMTKLLKQSERPDSIQVEINKNQRTDILSFMKAHGYTPFHEHHTRKGTELIEEGRDPENHAYNMIFRPTAL